MIESRSWHPAGHWHVQQAMGMASQAGAARDHWEPKQSHCHEYEVKQKLAFAVHLHMQVSIADGQAT
jgi:hypothetical protein